MSSPREEAVRVKELLQRLFRVYGDSVVVGLILPDGWYGRPYDNYYDLTSICVDNRDALDIDLGWGWRLQMLVTSGRFSDDFYDLSIFGRDIAMWSATSVTRFDSGCVKFVVDGDSTRVANVRDHGIDQLQGGS